MVVQSTSIAAAATIAIDGVRALVGGNSLDTMTSCAQASSDLNVCFELILNKILNLTTIVQAPHVGSFTQDVALGTKSTYPYMLRAIPSYREQVNFYFF